MPAMTPVPEFRQMVSKDLTGARRLQLLEGWNQNLQDWKLFLSTNPAGCFPEKA